MSGTNPSEPRRGRKSPEPPPTFIPQGNPRARTAYRCALFGLIPGVGLLLGPPAFIYGWLGLAAARTDPARRGGGHSCISMILGSLETIANSVGLTLLARPGMALSAGRIGNPD